MDTCFLGDQSGFHDAQITSMSKIGQSVFLDGSAAFQEDKLASLMSTWLPG